MKIVSIFLLVGLLFTISDAQTIVSGTITKDSVWSLANSPYIVNGSVTVNNPFTLTVDSGVVVRFTSAAYLFINGALHAHQSAVFTSSKDTVGGSPQKGDWGSINLQGGATSLILDTCQIKYGGGSAMINGTVGSAVPSLPQRILR